MSNFKEELEKIVKSHDEYFPDYIENVPFIAVKSRDSGDLEEIEEIDFENCDVTIHENYAEVYAGGDWQQPTSFDLVLNPNKKGKKYLAVNVRYHSDINGLVFYDYIKNEEYSQDEEN